MDLVKENILMNNDKLKKQLKKNVGFVPPGVMVAEKLGMNFQSIIGEYHKEIWEDGIIPLKYRYLIALATAIFDDNDSRARLELNKAIKYGATKEEILEVLKQQVWMKGAPTLVQLAPIIQIIDKKFEK